MKPALSSNEIASALKQEASRLGFSLSGIAACAMPGRFGQFQQWINNGYAGQMKYIEDRLEAYADPNRVLDGCRSIFMLAMQYGTNESKMAGSESRANPMESSGSGKIARYASFDHDYHDLIHARLKQLKAYFLTIAPESKVRGVVDTAPLLEREFAAKAGMGWIGKNTMLLNRQHGSYFFLAAILTDVVLPVDPEQPHNYCGTCTACLEACPTNAFPEPHVLDATKCISYLTIEHRGMVEPSLAEQLDGWVFGCDVCQEVCPWNRKAVSTDVMEMAYDPTLRSIEIRELLTIDERDFRQKFRKTPLWRSKRRGVVRNAILVAASKRMVELLPPIQRLTHDSDPVIAEAANWAAQHLGATEEKA